MEAQVLEAKRRIEVSSATCLCPSHCMAWSSASSGSLPVAHFITDLIGVVCTGGEDGDLKKGGGCQQAFKDEC